MIDVEGGSLCSLEHDVVARVDPVLEEGPAVDGHPLFGEALAVLAVGFVEVIDIELLAGLLVEDLLGEGFLLGNDVLEAFAERIGVEQIAHPDAATAGLVLVGRPDAALGRPGGEVLLLFLLDAVERAVIGENNVGALGDPDVRLETAFAEGIDLVEQRLGVDDATVTEDADLAANGSRRHQRQFVLLAVVDDGMSSVVAALIPGNDVGGVAVEVDDPTLAFVAELRPDDSDGHNSGGFFPGR